MDEGVSSFLKKIFREYYFENSRRVEFPTRMEEREFGYIPFNGTMIRHLSFGSPGELTAELVRQGPSSVYCSNARYSYPRLPMEEKGWMGAELIFDIDADMIPTPCKARHNRWYCPNCRKEGRPPRPATCPSCQRPEPVELRWTCRECLGATKEDVYRLVDLLERDFGTPEDEIRIHFSGNRGYHVQTYDERFFRLNSRARGEVANYIMGKGILLQKVRADMRLRGWSGRVRRSSLSAQSPTGSPKAARPSQKALNEAVKLNAATIDPSVTLDIHRIFRMPGTLHGGSGLLKMRVKALSEFDPLADPVVLGDRATQVHIPFAPRFELRGQSFGPYNSTSTTLPAYAAVFLLTKELAKLE